MKLHLQILFLLLTWLTTFANATTSCQNIALLNNKSTFSGHASTLAVFDNFNIVGELVAVNGNEFYIKNPHLYNAEIDGDIVGGILDINTIPVLEGDVIVTKSYEAVYTSLNRVLLREVQGAGKLLKDADITALNKVIPTGSNKNYIGSNVINSPSNSVKLTPTSNTTIYNKVDDYCATTSTSVRGQIGEEIAEELIKDMDGFVHYPCKLNGSDNGFDVVAIKGSPSNPTEIRIIESKPMNSGSVNLSVTVNKGTQMSDLWIDKTIEAMINSSNQNLIDLGTNLLLNRDKITKLISTVNKDTKEIIIIKLDAFNG